MRSIFLISLFISMSAISQEEIADNSSLDFDESGPVIDDEDFVPYEFTYKDLIESKVQTALLESSNNELIKEDVTTIEEGTKYVLNVHSENTYPLGMFFFPDGTQRMYLKKEHKSSPYVYIKSNDNHIDDFAIFEKENNCFMYNDFFEFYLCNFDDQSIEFLSETIEISR